MTMANVQCSSSSVLTLLMLLTLAAIRTSSAWPGAYPMFGGLHRRGFNNQPSPAAKKIQIFEQDHTGVILANARSRYSRWNVDPVEGGVTITELVPDAWTNGMRVVFQRHFRIAPEEYNVQQLSAVTDSWNRLIVRVPQLEQRAGKAGFATPATTPPVVTTPTAGYDEPSNLAKNSKRIDSASERDTPQVHQDVESASAGSSAPVDVALLAQRVGSAHAGITDSDITVTEAFSFPYWVKSPDATSGYWMRDEFVPY